MSQADQAILSLYVNNSFGVLAKVAGLFSRRGYNIRSIAASETEDPAYSRITIVTSGSPGKLEQIYRQVLKLEDVRRATLLPLDDLVQRELVLMKLRAEGTQEGLRALMDEFGVKIMDTSADGCVFIEYTGPTGTVDAVIERARPLGIVEISRTGVTVLEQAGAAE